MSGYLLTSNEALAERLRWVIWILKGNNATVDTIADSTETKVRKAE